MTNSLSIQIAKRKAEKHGGVSKAGRVYADFVVDGTPLSTVVKRIAADNISCLGWSVREAQDRIVSRLLVESQPEADERVPLYVCPECGDLACGAITAKVERDGDYIVWRDFAYETGLDIDPPGLYRSEFADVGPYRFAVGEYEPVIRSAYGVGGFLESSRSDRKLSTFLKKFFGIW